MNHAEYVAHYLNSLKGAKGKKELAMFAICDAIDVSYINKLGMLVGVNLLLQETTPRTYLNTELGTVISFNNGNIESAFVHNNVCEYITQLYRL